MFNAKKLFVEPEIEIKKFKLSEILDSDMPSIDPYSEAWEGEGGDLGDGLGNGDYDAGNL